ncbi:MAG: hypothetical protein BWK80_05785 [Desulfobacteraceae bacterium IS3]|jgi:hypothetical protein|nr:MAG: hypothetical protein BWK80_05785 [Desulfobacteraceae bacterium IS3]HAO23494.1 hypothetical protein [Desulfobacteraceae bacterium]
MEDIDLYSKAQLVVAAIRILEYRKNDAPSVEALCEMLNLSSEQGHLLCKKFHDMEIIEVVKCPFGARLFIRNYLKIEEISRDKDTSIQEEIEKFQNSRKDFKQKIESFQAEKAERQKTMFAEIEKKLKRNVEPV